MPGFLADECFSGPLLRALRQAGFDVSRSSDDAPGALDDEVLALAFAQRRVLLTEDNDFGNLVVRLRLPTVGVVRVALKSMPRPDQPGRVVKALTDLSDKVLGAMVTIEPGRARVRPLT